VLIFIGLLQEEVDEMTDPGAGCLIASFIYQFEDLNAEIRTISAESFLEWRQRLGEKFEAAMAQTPPKLPIKAEELADAMVSTFEGGFVMMRVLQDPKQLAQQLAHYRNYVELLFGVTS
jgi:TetR/AcrR family transcriptional repressor of nem operon